jgi:hypothetical protein
MRSRHILMFILLLACTLPTGSAAQAMDTWGVISKRKLDPRISQQIKTLAQQNNAQVEMLRSLREAKRKHAKLAIEFREEGNLRSFQRTLKRAAVNSASEATPELAQEGYTLEAFYPNSSRPDRIRLTAASAAGFHHALLRVPELIRIWPSALATELVPPPQAVHVERNNTRVIVADFPSFRERGIVEGFYGKPWTHQDRLDILRFEGQHGMNVYYYAPKDDPYHRRLWSDAYPPEQMARLGELVNAARANFVDFCFAVSPGLSMVYSSDEDFAALTGKLDSVAKLGVSCYGLFLDDVAPELQNPADQAKFKTLAQAHVYVINKLHQYLKKRGCRLTVTPTTYTNAWGSRDYIRELGAGVDPEVNLVWTGPEVASPEITVQQAQQWGEYLRRKPLVWDNFPVNDGRSWRLHLGPLRSRDANLPAAIRGLFSNPMNQAHASMIPLQTVADYLWDSYAYNPAKSHRHAAISQYGQEGLQLLAPFFKAYDDYWWDENVFTPLFSERRSVIDVPKIQAEIAQLDSSLEGLRGQKRFEKLLPEISPFPETTSQRLARLAADPAFRRLPDGKLQWREDYNVLLAVRASEPLKLDGDFSKWQSGPLYLLEDASQVLIGANHWKGAEHFSARFGLGWDDSYLYVGVDVTDPELYQPFVGRDIDEGDVIALMLETAFRKNLESTQSGADEYFLQFSPGDFAGVSPSIFSNEDYSPERLHPHDYQREIKTAWKKTATGYAGDIAIPVSYFEGGKFSAGYEIGLSLGAQKVMPEPKGGDEGALKRIVLTSKSDPLFRPRAGNPSSYQRVVLIDLSRP